MKNGADIDIVTLRPKGALAQEQEDLARHKERTRLREQASWQDITHTPDGLRLLGLVEQKLLTRITELVDRDPEAATLRALAQELGLKENTARKAAQKLTYIQPDDSGRKDIL